MGKRKAEGNRKTSKKFKSSGIIEPSTTGIYATCNRGKEQPCLKELINLFTEKAEAYYDLSQVDEQDEQEPDNLLIEEQIKKEVEGLKQNKKNLLFSTIDLDCECLVFIKTKKPIEPEAFVQRICQESHDEKHKNTRFTQKLTPITFSVTPTLEELKKLSQKVLAPHFHQENQEAKKFAIHVTRRNFNAIEKSDIIRSVAESVGRDHGHSVDLKQYDKLILIECYKSNIGMSVVENYEELSKFNLQQIYEKAT